MRRAPITMAALAVWLLAVSWPRAEGATDAFSAFRASARDAGLRDEIARIAGQALDAVVRRAAVPLPPSPHHPALKRSVGVFVTLVEDGRVRGCMGALEPVERDAAADIVRAAALAATEDRRYPALRPSELGRVVPVVSIVGPRRRVRSLSQLDPMRLGLFVEGNGRGGVLLPGEARSPGYQEAGCRAKAGLDPGAPVAMYVFPTVVFDGIPPLATQRRQP